MEVLLGLCWSFGRIDRIGLRVLGREGGAAIAIWGDLGGLLQQSGRCRTE